MTKHNYCEQIFGSLARRAQGYKRLQNESKMSSKFWICERNSSESQLHGLVTRNVVAHNIYTNSEQTLLVGSLIVTDGYERDDCAKIMLIIENKTDNPEENIFRCPVNAFIIVEEKVWNLIGAIPTPKERIQVARDARLCEQLCSIDVGSEVHVLPSLSTGVVVDKGPVSELGPGIFFNVELRDTKNEPLVHGTRTNYYTADALRPKPTSKDAYSMTRKDFEAIDNPYKSAENKRTEDRFNSSITSKSYKNKKFQPGDRIIWVSETGEQPGSVCYLTSYDNTIRVHLGNGVCKETRCERSLTNGLPADQLLTEQEYRKRKSNIGYQTKSKAYSSSNDEIRVDDLLDGDQLDNCSPLKNSYGIMDKEYFENENQFANEVTQKKYFGEDARSRKNANDSRKFEPLRSSKENVNSDELGVGSVVEVSVGGESHYGVIRWIGPAYGNNKTQEPLVAGIEMEEECENSKFEDGCLGGRKRFDCAPQRGYFTLLSHCRKDSRFQDSSYLCADETKTPDDLGRAVIPGIVEPISQTAGTDSLCGKYKGIQGHNNSCYLDATLFSMFTFTNVFDNLLYRPANESDITSYDEVQRVLREEIVNPLRKNLFVRADRVMKLRTSLDNLTSVTGLTCEEKDPEEFLTSLVAQVLKAEPFLKLSSGHEAYYYQLFVEKDERLMLPTVQQLFEQSLITSDIKLKEVPSCLIIQMPRFGKNYKMYPRILTSPILDVSDVIENSPRICSVCASLATYECKECFKDFPELQCFSFCKDCVQTAHSHDERIHHKYTPISVPSEFLSLEHNDTISRHYMDLFAVLCIETSHYVAFVKCGPEPDTPWCFFDSMADRKGGLNGFNIPEMVLCSELPDWLSDDGATALNEIRDDRHLPPYARRLLCDAYMCMYQSTDVMMYR